LNLSTSVPLNESLWEMDKFEQFIATRRKKIADAINELMEELSKGTPASLVSKTSTKELISKGEGQFLEFKSSLRWDFKTKMVNPALAYSAQVVTKLRNSDFGHKNRKIGRSE
jgi:hypothetical protein